jgi:superfamily II RNA helicase
MDIVNSFANKYEFPLDKFQIEAIHSLLNGNSVLVSAPTGSGKTLIAEFAVFDALDRNLKVIYTTPLKALSNQKYYDFCEEYGTGYVGLLTGDISINPNAPIVVMTTEILRNILYQDIRRLDSVMYVILDECHYMNDKDRGTVWEEVIIHCPKHILFVALSATISNSREIALWISSIHNKVDVILHSERPVPIEYLYFKENKIVNIFNNNNVNKKLFKEKHSNKKFFHGENPVTVIKKLKEKDLLPAIFFVFSRKGCDNRLEFCINNKLDLTNFDEKKIIKTYLNKIINDNPSLFDTSKSSRNLLNSLIYGIATHHAGLVPIMKHTVEYLFQKNLVKVIFATETLAAGINMPARTTVITSLSKRNEYGYEILSVNSFTQMTGRAGRRGMDKVGYCLIIEDNYVPFSEVYRLITSPPDIIKSNFTLSYNMVANLIKNFDYKMIINILQKSFGQYTNNHQIINMKLDLENQKKKINISPCKYMENNDILEEMPILEYNLIQKKILEKEHKINSLIKDTEQKKLKEINNFIFTSKRGSILVFRVKEKKYPVLGCIIEAYKDKVKNKKKSFAIVITNRGVCKINSEKIIQTFNDFKIIKRNDEVVHKVISKKEEVFIKDDLNKNIFSKKEEETFISKIKEKNYQDVIDKEIEELNQLKKELENHKCQNCSILKEHLKEYEKVKNININIDSLKRKIDYYSNMYLQEYRKLLNVLLKLEYIEKNNEEYYLTTKGDILSYIRSENDLAIAEMVNNEIFNNLNSQEIASILSLFLFEPRKEIRNSLKNLPEKIKNKISEINQIVKKINLLQKDESIEKLIKLEHGIVDIVLLWCNGSKWNTLFNKNEFDEGDIIRSFRRIIDMLYQLKNIPFISLELTEKFKKAIELLDRDLISLSIEDSLLREDSLSENNILV